MPLTVRAIVSLNQAKDFLGITRSTTDHDVILEGDSGEYVGLIEIASGRIEEYLDCKVKEQAVNDMIVSGDGSQFLTPRYSPILRIRDNSVNYLQYRVSASGAWTNIFDSQSDFNTYLYIDTEERNYRLEIIDSFKTFPCGHRNIRISYVAGYSTIPGNIVQVCLEMVKVLLDSSNSKAGKDRLGLSSQALSPGAASKSDSFLDMTPRWERMLAPYRKLVT